MSNERPEYQPFYAKFIGGPFDGLQIAARNGPMPFVMWMEAIPPYIDLNQLVVTDKSRMHRYERISFNDGVSWVFQFKGDVIDVPC